MFYPMVVHQFYKMVHEISNKLWKRQCEKFGYYGISFLDMKCSTDKVERDCTIDEELQVEDH